MSYLALVSLTATLIVVAATPGPGVFATVATAMATGFRSAVAVITGIVSGHMVFLVLALIGLSLAAKALGNLFYWVKLFGGLYLVWIGIRIFFSTPTARIQNSGHPVYSYAGNWCKGILVTFSNPKAILFYCSIFPTLMGVAKIQLLNIAAVSVLVALVFFAVLTGYALLASRMHLVFSTDRAAQRLNFTAGGVMVAAGVTIVAKS
jgi:threonine/homoserine/homoserine lactone efflux protein